MAILKIFGGARIVMSPLTLTVDILNKLIKKGGEIIMNKEMKLKIEKRIKWIKRNKNEVGEYFYNGYLQALQDLIRDLENNN